MDRALYKIRIGDKVKYEEVIPAVDFFNFTCCGQEVSISFEEKEAGLIKSKKCSECGKVFEVEIKEYMNYDDPEYHAYEYLKKELEKDDWIKNIVVNELERRVDNAN